MLLEILNIKAEKGAYSTKPTENYQQTVHFPFLSFDTQFAVFVLIDTRLLYSELALNQAANRQS